jgi:uncharacterized membrane protein YcaP (DUF421 family)
VSVEWSELFGLSVSPLDPIIRGTVMYLMLFVLFRVVIRRRVGAIGIGDILLVVIIADAAQGGLSGDAKSITHSALVVVTIVFWNWLIDWLNYRVPALKGVLEPPPLLLIEHGRVLRRNLRHEYVTEEELKSKLREKGVKDVNEVEQAYMEPDGNVSVIKRSASTS